MGGSARERLRRDGRPGLPSPRLLEKPTRTRPNSASWRAGSEYLVFAVKADTRSKPDGSFSRSSRTPGPERRVRRHRHEAWAIRQAYELVPTTDFSRSVLQDCPPFLAVSQLPPLTWTDFERRRGAQGLRVLGLQPASTLAEDLDSLGSLIVPRLPKVPRPHDRDGVGPDDGTETRPGTVPPRSGVGTRHSLAGLQSLSGWGYGVDGAAGGQAALERAWCSTRRHPSRPQPMPIDRLGLLSSSHVPPRFP
jgi:hypothetical protein